MATPASSDASPQKAACVIRLPNGGVNVVYDVALYKDAVKQQHIQKALSTATAEAKKWEQDFERLVTEQQQADLARQTTVKDYIKRCKDTDAAAEHAVLAMECATFSLCRSEIPVAKGVEYQFCNWCARRETLVSGKLSPLTTAEQKSIQPCQLCAQYPGALKFKECGHIVCIPCLQYIFLKFDAATGKLIAREDHAEFVQFQPGGGRCTLCHRAPLSFENLRQFQDVARTVVLNFIEI